MIRKHRLPASVRHLVPAAFVGGALGLSALAPFSAAARGLLGAALGAYGAASLGAAVMASRKGGWKYAPVLPVVFAAYHFSYGLGFLRGLATKEPG